MKNKHNVHSFFNSLALPIVKIIAISFKEIIELGLEKHSDYLSYRTCINFMIYWIWT